MNSTLDTLIDLGNRSQCALIDYCKYEGNQSRRLVEPYCIQKNNEDLMIICWQQDPEPGDGDNWRCFRVDRILAVQDGGISFTPRRQVTLSREYAADFQFGGEPPASLARVNDYYLHVMAAMKDFRLTRNERDDAHIIKCDLAPAQMRAVHGQILLDELRSVLVDGEISEPEAHYLEQVRSFLRRVGWAP